MRVRASIRAVVGVSLMVLLLNSSIRSQTQSNNYSTSSWAMGLDVPQGARLAGGGSVNWEDVRNVTALVILPNISAPDNIVYAVLSLMTNDSDVMQVAVGVFPNSTMWLVYSWLFTDLTSNPVKYQWILNSSLPEISPSATVSISIFHSLAGTWGLSVVDFQTDESVTQSFPTGIAQSLKDGDQEVIALESYSRSASTFEYMNNLTLDSLLIDGNALSGGFYIYDGGWDPAHNPLFVIGTAGQVAPAFISVDIGNQDALIWSYMNPWSNEAAPVGVGPVLFLVVLSVAIVIMFALVAVRMKLKRRA